MALTALPAVLGLAGGLASAGGTLLQGYATQQEANYKSRVAYNNAIVLNQQKAYVAEATNRKVADVSLAGREDIADRIAKQASSGVTVGTGSNAQVLESERMRNKLDALTAMNQGQVAEYGYGIQAASAQAESQLDKYAASTAMPAAELGAAGTVLGAGAKWRSPPGLTGGGSLFG